MKGYPIGEVLHSAYFDLEFPTIAKAGKGACIWPWQSETAKRKSNVGQVLLRPSEISVCSVIRF